MKKLLLTLAMFPILFVAKADVPSSYSTKKIEYTLLTNKTYGEVANNNYYFKEYPDPNEEYVDLWYKDGNVETYKPEDNAVVYLYINPYINYVPLSKDNATERRLDAKYGVLRERMLDESLGIPFL